MALRSFIFVLTTVAAGCSLFLSTSDFAGGKDDPVGGGTDGGDTIDSPSDGMTSRDGDVPSNEDAGAARYLYAIGGEYHQNAGPQPVLRAEIKADGQLGSWQPTGSAWASDRHEIAAAIIGPNIVLAGGRLSTGFTAKTETVRFLGNGMLSAPIEGPPLPSPRSRHGAVSFGNALAITGGLGGPNVPAPLREVMRTTVETSGATTPWAPIPELPAARYHAMTTQVGQLAIVAGGEEENNGRRATVYAGAVSGNALSWSVTTALPSPLEEGCAVSANGYVYVIGGIATGAAGDVMERTVLVAKATASGVGSWSPTSPLVKARHLHACAAVGNRIYVLGGHVGLPLDATVEVTTIAADGTLGAWSETTPLPASRAAFAVVAGP